MPGYVIHLAEAELILNHVRDRGVSDDWIQKFLTGTLLPDTRLKEQKRFSHFWNPNETAQIAMAPDLTLFLDKYGKDFKNPVLLGYFAHLHLDAAYVHTYWPKVIAFHDANGNIETLRARIKKVEILRLHKEVSVDEFFSSTYYYGEYTKLNGYFIDKYHVQIPRWETIDGFHMDEVEISDMACICRELAHLLTKYHPGDEHRIQIFDLAELEQFIAETADQFVKEYDNYIKECIV